MGFLGEMVDSVASWFNPTEQAHDVTAPREERPRSGVELCRVPAFGMGQPLYQGLKALGVDASHQWVRGPGFESGMGHDASSWNPLRVAWKDHHERGIVEKAKGNLDCRAIEDESPAFADVDPEDVARHARPGAKIAPMYKLIRDNCQSAAQGAVMQAAFEKANRCSPRPAEPTPDDVMSIGAPQRAAVQSLFYGYSS